jgi:tRNA nucleotidyltransferase (CCA-adding enzyme)
MTPASAGRRAASWKHFPHGADVGVRGYGGTKSEAFEQAALAMVAIATDLAAVRPTERVEVTCSAPDDELLLTNWLNALLYEMATRRMVFSRFAVVIEGAELRAELWGERFDRARHEAGTEVKGATLTAVSVARDRAGRWVAQCVVDV